VKRWKTKSRAQVVKDRWISLYADECELPDGHVVAPFYVLEEKDWVHIVAVDAQGAIMVARQYRYPADVYAWELPCGAIDPGEEPLHAAKRELREETGYVADQWKQVTVLYANPARQTNRIYCFAATNLTKAGAPSLEVTEDIETEFVSSAELMNRIATGDFAHALHVACYLLAANTFESQIS
jgi:ADP-ribose pyrophosphatase